MNMGTNMNYYYVMQFQQVLWYALAILGTVAVYRKPSMPMFLITAGTVLIAVVTLLYALFPPSGTLNSDGEWVTETEGLLSANIQILTSVTGLFLITIGSALFVVKLLKTRDTDI